MKKRGITIAQNAVNCWLSYVLSQPAEFQLDVISVFLVRFFGLGRITAFCTRFAPVLGYYKLTFVTALRVGAYRLDLPEPTLSGTHEPYAAVAA